MSWGNVEPVSTIMLNSSAVCMFLLVPLSDSLDPTFAGPRTVRTFATLTAVAKLYGITWCKSSPPTCRAQFHDYNMTVVSKIGNASFNTTGNSSGNTAVLIFSTLDLMHSLDSIILVLSLQVHMHAHMCMRKTMPVSVGLDIVDPVEQYSIARDNKCHQGAVCAG